MVIWVNPTVHPLTQQIFIEQLHVVTVPGAAYIDTVNGMAVYLQKDWLMIRSLNVYVRKAVNPLFLIMILTFRNIKLFLQFFIDIRSLICVVFLSFLFCFV